jgi:ligand-binding SRPBCC domain-containing protein
LLQRSTTVELVFEQFVSAPTERVFAFHENPGNLPRLLRSWPRFRLLRCEPIVRIGGVLWIEETFWGLPVALGFTHSCYDPPHRMGSRLFHGPFARFTHDYRFVADGDGTRMCITLDVSVPWHFGGDWLLKRSIAPQIRTAFLQRLQELERLAAAREL